MTLLTTGDLGRITGKRPTAICKWADAGLLVPVNPGRGKGNQRLFTLGDAVAVAAGIRYRTEGAEPERVHAVVRFLSGLGLERLERELDAGRTWPAPGPSIGAEYLPGTMIAPPAEAELTPGAASLMRRLDLRAVVKDVKAKAARLDNRPAVGRKAMVAKR